ncbi:MAG: hypothetical protein QM767_18035 [Anaeromyxobacter sp.]
MSRSSHEERLLASSPGRAPALAFGLASAPPYQGGVSSDLAGAGADAKAARGRVSDLALQLLSETPIRPVAALAGLIAQSPLRVRMDLGRDGRGGGAEVTVVLRWRLDAGNGFLPPNQR